jgi:uncharacterized protein involved in type VI secretion and phage assembly
MSSDLTAGDVLAALRGGEGATSRYPGVYPATVVDLKDSQSQGRVKVRLPWAVDVESAQFEVWARLATLMAGGGRGSWFVPEVGDEVVVAFEAGNPVRPYVLGALWNGNDAPPVSMDGSGKNNIRRLHSRAGSTITLDDTDGSVAVRIETPLGQSIEIDDSGSGSVEVRDASGNSIRMESSGVTITGASKVTVNATTVSVSAASVSVSAGMSTFSGVVQCDTLITNSVISASYTPGAGNIW